MKKFFSLIAAVLFAGSMMASEAIMQYTGGVTTNMVGDGANNAATVGLDADLFTVLADKGDNQNLPGLNKANDIRLYADKNSGNGNTITVSIASGTITSIVLDIKQTATFVVKAGETAVTEEEGAYAINATSFSIQNTTTGVTTQLQLNKITITYESGDVTPTVNYYVAGSMNGWAADEAYMLTPNNQSLYEGEFTFAANDEFKVIGFDGTNTSWFPEGMGNNFQITEAGDYKITFNPAGNVEGWYEGFFNVVKKEEPVVFSHELYGSEALPVINKTYFATGEGWAADADSHAEIVNDYDINLVLVASKASAWQSQVFVNPGFAWEVGAYYKMEFDLTTNHQLGGVHVKVNDDNTNFFYDSYPNDNIFLANQTTHYVADSIYAVVEPTNGGQLIFSVGWCDANTEILISNIVITKYEAPAQNIDITISKGMMFSDAVASYGYWDIYGENENYAIELSNISTTEVPGVYTVEDLDADYSYVVALAAPEDTIHFTAGQVEVAVSAEGVVTVVGQLTGDDSNIYNINLTYKDPVAEKTVTVAIPEATLFTGYATYGLYGAYGYTADSATYVQLGIWTETEFAGDFTEDDLDYKYIGSGLIDADGTQSIFSAAITVTPGNGEGVYRITADILCYNNTLYKVTMQIGTEQGIEDVDAAVKAIKSIVNGQLVIEKAGVKYNAQGAVIR